MATKKFIIDEAIVLLIAGVILLVKIVQFVMMKTK